MPIRSPGSASFSDSIPPLYEHGSAHSTWDAPLAQTELYSHSRKRILPQEEIGFQRRADGGTKTSLRSSRDRSHGDQAPTPPRSTRPSGRHQQRENVTVHPRHITPRPPISPNAKREARKEKIKAVERGPQRTSHTYQTSPKRRSQADSVDVERFGPGEADDRDDDDERPTQDEDDDEYYDRSQAQSGEDESSNYEDEEQDGSEDLGSEDEDGSGENEDSDDSDGNRRRASTLIPKPDGEVTRPGRGGYTLSTCLGWSKKEYKRFTNIVKLYMNETLELSQSFGEQEVEAINLVCKLVIKKLPILSDYEDAWPIKDVIRCQLKYQRTQRRWKETRADAELGRRFKKAKRG